MFPHLEWTHKGGHRRFHFLSAACGSLTPGRQHGAAQAEGDNTTDQDTAVYGAPTKCQVLRVVTEKYSLKILQSRYSAFFLR